MYNAEYFIKKSITPFKSSCSYLKNLLFLNKNVKSTTKEEQSIFIDEYKLSDEKIEYLKTQYFYPSTNSKLILSLYKIKNDKNGNNIDEILKNWCNSKDIRCLALNKCNDIHTILDVSKFNKIDEVISLMEDYSTLFKIYNEYIKDLDKKDRDAIEYVKKNANTLINYLNYHPENKNYIEKLSRITNTLDSLIKI